MNISCCKIIVPFKIISHLNINTLCQFLLGSLHYKIKYFLKLMTDKEINLFIFHYR